MATLVQNAQGYEATDDTSFALAFASNVTANNLLVIGIATFDNAATISTVTDTVGTTYTQAGTLLRNTSFTPNPMLAVYYGVAAGSGANTITVTFSAAAQDKNFTVWELSGVDTTTPLNQTAGATGNPSPAASGNITTTQPGFIIKFMVEYAWASGHNHAVGTPTTGWTEFADTAQGSDTAYRNETTTGTFNGGFSWTGGGEGWCCRIVAFADAAAGGQAPRSMHQFRQRRR